MLGGLIGWAVAKWESGSFWWKLLIICSSPLWGPPLLFFTILLLGAYIAFCIGLFALFMMALDFFGKIITYV